MSGIMDLLNSDMGKQIVSSISQKTGLDADQAGNVVASSLPAILGQMQNNAFSESGPAGLMGALFGGKKDGSILDS